MHLEDLVEYYSYSRRGLVCALKVPISQKKEQEEEEEALDDPDDSGDHHMTYTVEKIISCKGGWVSIHVP